MEGWRKSSYSDGNGVILVRDTTDRDGVTLSIPATAWQGFTNTLK